MSLIITIYFGMQTYESHEKGGARTSMTEDKELRARKELLDLCNFFGRNRRDWIALILSRIPFEQNTDGAFNAREHSIEFPDHLFQFNITNPAKQTKIPKTLIQFNLSLKTKIATGTRISEATTLVNTAAIPRFQPVR